MHQLQQPPPSPTDTVELESQSRLDLGWFCWIQLKQSHITENLLVKYDPGCVSSSSLFLPWLCWSSMVVVFFDCVISFPHFIWTAWPLPVSAPRLSAAALWLSAYLFLVWLSSICWCETTNCLIASLCLLDSENPASLMVDTISDFAEI